MKRILKSSLLLLFIVLVAGVQQVSAQSLKEFFNSSEVPLTYLGVDFTRAKILNEVAVNNMDIRDRQFPAINQVIINEPKKYDFQKAFSKTTVNNDIALVNAKNAKIDAEKLVESGSDAVHLKKADIDVIVKSYDFGGKKGIGLMFIMESMNKASAEASMYVTLIDLSSRKVLLTERMTAKAAGFGFRNYWAKTIYEVLADIKKSKYKEWKAAN
ncbi:hypothetical protein DC498_23275 [Terrimonas sp.]|uniref:hypothetical protein n=1 Tax=Terrimonas sp. TaxID=1914338 RepID=UPI000D510DF1|nr:hypothetical protein [Terrimonas sp.]PVD49772.1 hypothetical protein DC498_23275 [Terrimonas sp.]